MFDNKLFKGIAAQLNAMTQEERDSRADKLRKHLADEMKRRKLKPLKPKK